MKKIISLLASVAMLAAMVTSVSAATIEGNAPVVSTTVEEIDAVAFEEFAYETLEEGQKAYLVTADFTGLDLSNQRASDDNKSARTGILMSAASYEIVWDSEEAIVAIYNEDREAVEEPGIFEQSETSYSLFSASTAAKMYPTTKNTATKPVEVTEFRANSFVVVTDGTPVTGTVEGIIVVRNILANVVQETKNFGKADVSYEVNGEAGNVVTLGEAGGEEPPVDDDETKAEVSDKIDLKENNVVIGAAWDVLIKNFDSAKSYMTTFTDLDTEETRDDEAKAIDVSMYAETTGDVGFAVIMRLTAERNVALTIDVQ